MNELHGDRSEQCLSKRLCVNYNLSLIPKVKKTPLLRLDSTMAVVQLTQPGGTGTYRQTYTPYPPHSNGCETSGCRSHQTFKADRSTGSLLVGADETVAALGNPRCNRSSRVRCTNSKKPDSTNGKRDRSLYYGTVFS